jgi:ribosomal protein S18 acetylase RimI-like enzyme
VAQADGGWVKTIAPDVSLPTGLRLRPYAGDADVPGLVRVINAEWEHDGVPARYTVDEKLNDHSHPSDAFDARRDVTIAEVDGAMVGYSVRGWTDAHDSFVRQYRVDGSVVPAWRGRGIGRAILRESMRLATELARTHDMPRARVFGSQSHEGQPADEALLAGEGFAPVRYFFDMTRPDLDDIPELDLPAGLEVRPVTLTDARAVWQADVEAFRDHWGGYEASEANFQRWLESPETDPSLWIIAFDGSEIAAGVIVAIYPQENAALGVQRGWLDDVFTRAPWRRRGLARALMTRALRLIRERGMTSAVLDVDAANPTGALGLYESLGFVVERRSTAWRKPFDS